MTFEQIYNEFFKIIYSYIIMRVRDDGTAQDLAALTWQKVLKNLNSFDESKGNIRQWLFTIARNEINSHHRLYYVKKFLSLTGFEDNSQSKEKDAAQSLIDNEEKETLLRAMDGLNAKERDVVSLKFYSGMSGKEIAQAVNISETNVSTIMNRALGKLRVSLEAK
ncbi:RNA polymerase sigma-70 factor (ECF subfamily) [Elusimicrobium simillimum]|uniref:RNA polymerase sigma factor n=1 Tax=Elusimicrobium simillimum TaxID=3143438 RepID=UPI003C6EE058